jgi:ketopantoate reductase
MECRYAQEVRREGTHHRSRRDWDRVRAHLGAAGHSVSVLSHPPRTDNVRTRALIARDARTGSRAETRARVVPTAAAGSFDLVVTAVRSDQLAPACAQLAALTGVPTVLFFGNNPGGRSAIPADIPGDVRLGFPGVGGVLRDGVAEYVRIKRQPTALPATSDPRLADMERALRQREFSVQRVTDMDGWLGYHAAFVACVTAALYRCGTAAAVLAADRQTLTLMCAAVTEAFAALRKTEVAGLPRNLAILHSPLLKPAAIRY